MTNASATNTDRFDHPWRGLRLPALIVGVVGLVALVTLGLGRPGDAFRGYLYGFLFWLAISAGSLIFMMLWHLVGGDWGLAIRRQLHAASRNMPLMALFCLPLLLGLRYIYPWAMPGFDFGEGQEHKRWYFGPPREMGSYTLWAFFTLRAVFYFVFWSALAYALVRWTRQQEEAPTAARANFLTAFSGPMFVATALVGTLAAVDWVMSLDPHWYSSIYGLYFLVGQALTTMAFCVLLATREALKVPPSPDPSRPYHDAAPAPGRWAIPPSILHDLGNLLFMLTNLYAYATFSQFIIIWSGNIPEEVTWYLDRTHGGWRYVPAGLVIFHWAAPFVILLSRKVKRRADILRLVAALILAARLVETAWIVIPSFRLDAEPEHLRWTLIFAVVSLVGVGGIWLAAFASWAAPPPPQPRPVDYTEIASNAEALT